MWISAISIRPSPGVVGAEVPRKNKRKNNYIGYDGYDLVMSDIDRWREEASIATAFAYVFAVVFIGWIVIQIFMPVGSFITNTYNSLTGSGLIPTLAAQQSSMSLNQVALQDFAFIALIFISIWAVMQAKTRRDNEV